ncbi:hypothetical protein LTR06_000678 [Exophiala xenobiotica]|nr:hypothetical protein LTR06_000678 [Exophiala xenobiotica]
MEEENDAVMLEHPPPYQDEAPSSSAIVPPVQQVAPTMHQPFLRAGDVVLAVMGVTGAGKSTFVSLLSPDKDVEIGHDLRSRTKHVSVHGFRLSDGRQGWLMDTPGFDDTSRSDTEILREISSALTELYTRGVRLSGILYLHRIVDPKMGHSAIRNLEIFKRLCGKEAMQGVAFVTTRWDGMEEGSPQWTSAVEREKQLRSSDKYWAGMIREGANVVRHFGTRTAALTVVDLLMQKQFGSPLAIQTELAKEMRSLDQTAAGRFLAQEQEELQARYAQEMKDLEQEREEALQQRDRVLAEELANQQQKYRAQHADFASARQELHVDFQQMSKENAQRLVYTSQSSQQDSASTQQMKAQMDLIAQNVAEIQDEMERRDREHEEQIARLRKQARNRDKQHEAETIRLIEQTNVSHEHERKRSHRMLETLRKPHPDSRDRRDRYSDQRDHHRDRNMEPDGFTKLLRWLKVL